MHIVNRGDSGLPALEPESPHPARGPAGEPDSQQAGRQRARVGQHVTGIGQQSQRMPGERHRHLKDQEAGDQPQRAGDVAPVSIGGNTVTVLIGPARTGMLVPGS